MATLRASTQPWTMSSEAFHRRFRASQPKTARLNREALIYSSSYRVKRFDIVERQIKTIIRDRGGCTILDVGGDAGYWHPFMERLAGLPITVLLANLRTSNVDLGDARFSFKHANACDLSFAEDRSFDLVHSNSVIEHVGLWRDMKAMAAEIMRVGSSYYVQTPYFWFPYEPHARMPGYQLLPHRVRARLHRFGAIGFYPQAADLDQAMIHAQDAAMLDKQQMRALFADGTLIEERAFGLTKSLIMVRDQSPRD